MISPLKANWLLISSIRRVQFQSWTVRISKQWRLLSNPTFCRMWHLIWVYTFCHWHIRRMIGLYWLRLPNFFLLLFNFATFLMFTSLFSGNVTCFDDTYTVSLFDNSGLQEYAGLREFGYSESHVIAICFSLTDRASFNNVKEFWAPEVRRYLGSKKSIVLVGLQGDNTANTPNVEQVSIEECQKLGKQIHAKKYLECTPRDSAQATELFKDISKIYIKQNKRFRFGKLWGKWERGHVL